MDKDEFAKLIADLELFAGKRSCCDSFDWGKKSILAAREELMRMRGRYEPSSLEQEYGSN